MIRKLLLGLGLGLAALSGAQAQPSADTLAAIKARGQLVCGVSINAIGFAVPDNRGTFRGLDVDACRAIAAAILGDANKVRFVPTTTQVRFTALQSGEVDVLIRNTTWSLGREAQLGLAFASINFYDGQGFMVKKSSGVTSAKQLDGATVCVQPGTTTELNLADWFRANNLRFTPVIIEQVEEIRTAFVNGRCDAYTNDASSLASFRASQGAAGEDYLLLPEIISKEPLGAVVRKGDWRFFDVVRWSHFAMVSAEELGITSQNIDSFASSPNPDVQRLLGRTGEFGKAMGIENDWAVKIIRQVGNLGETWERNITPLGIPRGINALWNKGGLQYAPPIR
ncbi:amino acid ABC transporter substrate-binding protein [Belnapia sp. T6]|uniref:Amino acid ABC transporter substrate-binding protein n=1 Tax=Belnapia mucosa TaxID=2804532 RepID=A0ABS1VAU3_9PROT|nr:amino acid ABC transporter substrate-binding protein [Belnapia mucosa]MBL6458790.1 amino acid ABC transporter substrate-binding protein [Belnapia mucosa]